jgi:hypothetical protein
MIENLTAEKFFACRANENIGYNRARMTFIARPR